MTRSSENDAFELLRSLAIHVEYDSGVTGSKFGDSPCGRVPLGANSFWTKGSAPLLKADGKLALLVQDIDAYLRGGHGGDTTTSGVLPIDSSEGSLWRRIQSNFDRPPEMIADVVAPILKSRLES
jgi:hypothetical protein